MWQLTTVLTLLVAADPGLGEAACDFKAVGVANRQVIDDFVASVRARLEADDPGAIARLIGFPLTVNARDPRFGATRHRTFASEAEFVAHETRAGQRQGHRVLDVAYRNQVIRRASDGMICRSGALGLADGLLWASPGADGTLHVTRIHNDAHRWPQMTKGELLRCQTDAKVVVIDRPGKLVRYRAWTSTRVTTGKPDDLREGGVESLEGTGPCVHSAWTFGEGPARLLVEEAGCAEDADPRPIGFVNSEPCLGMP